MLGLQVPSHLATSIHQGEGNRKIFLLQAAPGLGGRELGEERGNQKRGMK